MNMIILHSICPWIVFGVSELKLLEAEEARWLTKDTLFDVEWLPADITIVEEIKKQLK